jgi:hypothetical protein
MSATSRIIYKILFRYLCRKASENYVNLGEKLRKTSGGQLPVSRRSVAEEIWIQSQDTPSRLCDGDGSSGQTVLQTCRPALLQAVVTEL